MPIDPMSRAPEEFSGDNGPAETTSPAASETNVQGASQSSSALGWISRFGTGIGLQRFISAKLVLLLVGAMAATFVTLGVLHIYTSRRTVEKTTLGQAQLMSDVIRRSTSHHMMRNDRRAIYEMMSTMADEPGVVRLRIINPEGKISFSTTPEEIEQMVDKRAELCTTCHRSAQVVSDTASDRSRIYRQADGGRVIAVITPIYNEPACSNAACHAHPANQKVLGVLDTHLSMAAADANIAQNNRWLLATVIVAIIFSVVIIWWFVWQMVHKPLTALQAGTERLASGDLGHQIDVTSSDEVGELGASFNTMSCQLLEAQTQIKAWAQTLETRVEKKTKELKRAHDQMMNVEKMLTIGEMAAVVAHEINNPLAGILTYAKLVKKWILRGITEEQTKQEACDCLDLIASESRRCGDLVKNLLVFSRKSPIHMENTDLNAIVARSMRLVQHRIDLQSIQVQSSLQQDLPLVYCDGSQIEQVLLALVMNAIDAMPHGGNLWMSTRQLPNSEIELQVRDDGMGIPPELMPKIFEPFTTTKEVGKGVGLGLAVSRGIVDRHCGRIELQSELGVGTQFRVILPLDARVSEAAQTALANASQ
jgi:two-component system NtrC family sensor kinase